MYMYVISDMLGTTRSPQRAKSPVPFTKPIEPGTMSYTHFNVTQISKPF